MLLQWGSYNLPSVHAFLGADEEDYHYIIQRNLYSLCLNEHLHGP